MLRFASAVLSACCLLPLCAIAQKQGAPSTGQPEAAAIQGAVLDPKGGAVPRASVAVFARTENVATTQTDERGQFAFPALRPGSYFVVASAPGLAASSGDLSIAAGETRQIELKLALSAVDQHVVVSASLGDVLATESGSSITVIDGTQMSNRNVQTVSDVLREVPGVAVADTGRRGGATGVFIRGGNSNYNLIMVDGIPLNQFGGDFDFSPLTTDGLSRIEVVRGSQSALYGSNAVTGVVNLVTPRGEGSPEFNAVLEGGSYDTYRLATAGAGSEHGFHWSYDLSRLASAGVVTNDDYRNQTALVSLGFSRSPRRELDFHFYGDANDAGEPGPFGSDPDHLFGGIDPTSRFKQYMYGYQATESEQITGRWRQVSTISVTPDRYYFISSFGDSFEKNLRIVANTRSEITLGRTDVLVGGFEYNRESYEDTFVSDGNSEPFVLPRTSLAYFVENRWTPSRWTLTTGMRVDDIRTHSLAADEFGARPFLPASSVVKVNPRASASYLLRQGTSQNSWGATRAHASVGTGIRPPDGFELGFTDNPRLRPERSITTDAGIEQRLFRDRVVLDATYFYNRFEDQIVTLGGSLQNLSTFTSDNLNNSRAQGLETSVRLQPIRSLEITGAYTWMDTEILALDGSASAQSPFQVGQPLIRRPRNSGSWDVTWQRGRLRLNTNGYARGPVLDLEPNDGAFACSLGLPCLFTNKGYVLANAGFAVRTLPGLELYGQLNNLLNQKYEEVLGYPAYRLNFMAGIKLRLPWERGTKTRP